MDEERLELLLHRYFDQVLTIEEREELEVMLLGYARARETYWEAARWNALVRQWGEAEWGRCDARRTAARSGPTGARNARLHVRSRRTSIRWLWPATAVATLVVAGFVGYRFWFPAAKPGPKGVAVLTRISESFWADQRRGLQVGEALQPGWLRLDRGAAQIEFSRGARVVLEAPAELQLVSEREVFLRSGKLSAHVPEPAHGFRVVTPKFTVVDQGTEFGCSVGSEGVGEVHVFAGSVSCKPAEPGKSGRELKKNQALRVSGRLARTIPSDRSAFLSEAELAELNAARERARLEGWRASSRSLREQALVYLDFERESEPARILPNRATRAPANSDASVIGCDWVEGRWAGKGAVEFKRPDDRLRLTVPGQFRSLTFLTWVRVDDLPNNQNSLLMTESFEPGEVHWYLYHDGRQGLGVYQGKPGQSRGWRYLQSPALQPEEFGTWTLLATVFDGSRGEVTHYVDGQAVGNHRLGIRVPLRLDTFEIGNWGVRYNDLRWPQVQWRRETDAERNFRGRMDELAILPAALGPEDIGRVYREGRPGEATLTLVTSR